MGTTLLHLLPEVMEDVEQGLKQNDIKLDYPIATLTVGLGFLLIVFVEMLAHTIQVHIGFFSYVNFYVFIVDMFIVYMLIFHMLIVYMLIVE